MSLLTTACAVRAGREYLRGMLVAFALVLLGVLFVSCGGSQKLPAFGSSHNAYVTRPSDGSVLLLHIDGLTGAITTKGSTPQVVGTSPNGLALLSNKFLYVANALANTISIFNVASDGTLTANSTPVPAGGSGPFATAIDPSGKYLLVTNRSLSNSISVFNIDPGTGALTPVSGSPFPANDSPGEILIPPSGDLVYVTNSSIGAVTAFTFSSATGLLTTVPGSPFISGSGASGLTIDGSGSFLYVANTSAPNPTLNTNGNVSGFSIDKTPGPLYGHLDLVVGSPFTSPVGSGPSALVVDPSGRFVFATTPGSNFSVWCFQINSPNGQLTSAPSSPFSVAAGGLFALIDPRGNFFYIGDQTAGGVDAYTYDQNTCQPKPIPNSPFSTGTAPGKMLIAD